MSEFRWHFALRVFILFLVVVIYTAAGTHPIQNNYSHGSRFPCQKVYIHGCSVSSIKVLFTRQPFLIPKGLYTRLPCIKYKSTAVGTHPIQNDYSHISCFPCHKVYIHGCRVSRIKVLFTRQPFLIPKGLYTRLPYIKYKSTAVGTHPIQNEYSHGSRFPCQKV